MAQHIMISCGKGGHDINLPVHGIEHCLHTLQAPVIKLLAACLVGREEEGVQKRNA